MLTGKTALVTGGGRGIGKAIALALAKAGAQVAIFYAGNEAAANVVVAEAMQHGVKAKAYRCDVSNVEQVKVAVENTYADFEHIDILVNNAGIVKDTLLMRMKDEEFEQVMDTNLKGAFLMTRQVVSPMIRRKAGRIINISSVVGLMGNAGQANYAASKAGLVGLSKSVAREVAGRGVTCNVIAPGFIQTDMTKQMSAVAGEALLSRIPMGRMGTPEDVANLVVFLCSDYAAYITGEVIRVDGGMCM